jgi:hypothetical protein
MVGFNPIALSCTALLLGVAIMLTVRTRKMAWPPAFMALVLISGYEFLHVAWQKFIYIDDNKKIPTSLHLASGSYLVALGVGALGLAFLAIRYVVVRMRTAG